MMTLLWLLIAIVAIIILMVIVVYNSLVSLKNRTDEAWSDIDVQLKRRYDLIPNLVDTVKGSSYAVVPERPLKNEKYKKVKKTSRRIRPREEWIIIPVPVIIETELFEKVTKARTAAIDASGVKDQQTAENELTKTLKSVFAVAENYPNLRASENFQKLQDELTDTENKIEAARRFYNGNVRDLNIRIESFPSSVIANMFSFRKKELFQIEGVSEKEPVKVDFDK